MADPSATERHDIEKLADAFMADYRTGRRPSILDYAQQYPELAQELHDLLQALVLLEQNAPERDETEALSVSITPSSPPREIGEYLIVREIGRGGMGIVYEAVQQSLGRHVALKVLSSPGTLNPSHLERFRLEARAAAQLHHSHIVPVFGVGESDGISYYAMQFIQGQSLDLVIDALRNLRRRKAAAPTQQGDDTVTHAAAIQILSGQPQSDVIAGISNHCASPKEYAQVDAADVAANVTAAPATDSLPEDKHCDSADVSQTTFASSRGGREYYRSVARVGLQVADALAYAHNEGILHRDIKPSNLLLDAKANVWITDFGLAKAEDSEGVTQTGDLVGTLRYMAPERLEGWSDRRSDIYSLGATLYELVTLTQFLESDSRGQMVDRILNEMPERPSKIDPLVPRDLETIILTAIAKEPSARYHTAEAMAADLNRFLEDRPILARRSTLSERFLRWCRRNPTVATLTGAVAALLVAAVATLAISNVAIVRERDAKSLALKEKESALQLARANERQALTESAKSKAVAELLQEMLSSANPEQGQSPDYTVRELLGAFSARLNDQLANQPEVEATLRSTVGKAYWRLGLFDQADVQLKAALELRRASLGAHHDPYADSLLDYAWNLAELMRHDEAIQLVREAIDIYHRNGGSKEKTLNAMWALQRFLATQNKFVESDMVGDQAIAMVGNLDKVEYPVVANILHVRADSRKRQRRFAEAEADARRSVELHRRLHGAKHPETGWGLVVLGTSEGEQRNLSDGTNHLREALEIFRHNFDAGHEAVKFAETELKKLLAAKLPERARQHAEAGRFDEAAEVFAQIIDAANDDWYTASPRKSFCREIAQWGEVFDRVAKLRPNETALWVGRAQYHAERSQWLEAEANYAKVIRARSLQEEHVDYARLLMLRGADSEYQTLCREMVERSSPPKDIYMAHLLACLCAIGPAECVESRQLVDWANQSASGGEWWQLHGLGIAYLRDGQVEAAIKTFHESNNKLGQEATQNMFGLALAHQRLGKLDAARQHLQQLRDAVHMAQPSNVGEPARFASNDWICANVMLRELESSIHSPEPSVSEQSR